MTSPFPDMTKETRDTTGTSRAYSNKRCRKNKYSSSQEPSIRTREKRGRNKKVLLCDGYR